MDTIEFLHHIRGMELERAMAEMPAVDSKSGGVTVLDIGAGTGWQAKELSERGFNVIALDVSSSAYRDQRVFHVTEYDGRNIPIGNDSIDVVFSSNVLEHVVNIDDLLDEVHRILIPGGMAVHVLPTSACRFWSLIAHYGWLARRILEILKPKADSHTSLDNKSNSMDSGSRSWIRDLIPSRHGERGIAISEIYYYSEYWWVGEFKAHGFLIEKITKNNLFYSMANFLQFKLSIARRQWLARYLGSSCKIYKTCKHTER